jgi:hypothetical protein
MWILVSGEYRGQHPVYTHVWTGRAWSRNFDAAKKYSTQVKA